MTELVMQQQIKAAYRNVRPSEALIQAVILRIGAAGREARDGQKPAYRTENLGENEAPVSVVE